MLENKAMNKSFLAQKGLETVETPLSPQGTGLGERQNSACHFRGAGVRVVSGRKVERWQGGVRRISKIIGLLQASPQGGALVGSGLNKIWGGGEQIRGTLRSLCFCKR